MTRTNKTKSHFKVIAIVWVTVISVLFAVVGIALINSREIPPTEKPMAAETVVVEADNEWMRHASRIHVELAEFGLLRDEFRQLSERAFDKQMKAEGAILSKKAKVAHDALVETFISFGEKYAGLPDEERHPAILGAINYILRNPEDFMGGHGGPKHLRMAYSKVRKLMSEQERIDLKLAAGTLADDLAGESQGK